MSTDHTRVSVRTVLLVLLALGMVGTVWGVWRLLAREADAIARVEAAERRTVAAEQARHRATVAYVAVRDSSRVELVRSVEYRDRVRVVDLSTVEIRVTPASPPERVALPPIVVARLVQDSVTIATQVRALVRADSLSAADSTTIAALQEENASLRKDRPRWRFVHGVVAGLGVALAAVTAMLAAQ